jgi:hypothetical protein
LLEVCKNSAEICWQITNYGVIKILKNEIKKCSKGTALLTQYLIDLLNLIHQLLKLKIGLIEFGDSQTMESLVNILEETGKREARYFCLKISMYITKENDQRRIFQKFNGLNIIRNSLLKGIDTGDK